MTPEEFPIMNKYELEKVPIGIGGKRMQFYRIADWEPFIKNLFSGESGSFTDFPHWIKIWEASLVLTDYLLDEGLKTEGQLETSQSVLETGAGMGITGMFLAAFGYSVLLTDYDEDCLELLRLNIAHNELNNARVRKLDWNQPEIEGQFDIICGAEVIYRESIIPQLTALFRKHLKPGGRIYLAHDHRRSNVEKFIARLPADMRAETVVKTFRGQDMARRIVIQIIGFA